MLFSPSLIKNLQQIKSARRPHATNFWLMKTGTTRRFLKLNFSVFFCAMFQFRLSQMFLCQVRLGQFSQVRLKTRAKIDILKSPCIFCLHLSNFFTYNNFRANNFLPRNFLVMGLFWWKFSTVSLRGFLLTTVLVKCLFFYLQGRVFILNCQFVFVKQLECNVSSSCHSMTFCPDFSVKR